MESNILSKYLKFSNKGDYSQCYLINCQDNKLILDSLQNWAIANDIASFDQHILTDSSKIKIADIRQLFKIINYKNYSSKFKLVVVQGVDNISHECANALLKTLEEPPNQTIIILISKSVKKVLPTIISRCKLIRINNPINITQEKSLKIINQIQTIKQMSIKERFQFVDDLIKENDINEILTNWLLIYREKIFLDSNFKKIKKITNLQKMLATTNVGKKLLLENIIINI